MPQRPGQYRPFPKRPSPSEAARPSANQRGYTSRWQRFRLTYLAENPLCLLCRDAGKVTAATCIDHKDGEGPNGKRGYDPKNLVSMCDSCHSRKTVERDGGLGRSKETGQ